MRKMHGQTTLKFPTVWLSTRCCVLSNSQFMQCSYSCVCWCVCVCVCVCVLVCVGVCVCVCVGVFSCTETLCCVYRAGMQRANESGAGIRVSGRTTLRRPSRLQLRTRLPLGGPQRKDMQGGRYVVRTATGLQTER